MVLCRSNPIDWIHEKCQKPQYLPSPFGKIVFFSFSFFSFVFISDYLVEKKPENESFFIIFL
jgi:hypothetical protein